MAGANLPAAVWNRKANVSAALPIVCLFFSPTVTMPGERRLQSRPRLDWTTEVIMRTVAAPFHVGLAGVATRRPPTR